MDKFKFAFKTLEILSDGNFHSGEEIARAISSSRVTVWKSVKQLKTIGVEVFAVRKKGYRLAKQVEILNENKVSQEMGELSQFINLEFFNVIESTNTYLLKESENKPHATVVLSNIQTKGKGRRGRSWQSKLGESLTMSILWKFGVGASRLSGLSLVIGIALKRAMDKLNIPNIFLKWPNDLMLKNDENLFKIGGVLIELKGDMESRCSAIIGIGINYEASNSLLKKIDQPAAGIKNLLSPDVSPNHLVCVFIKEVFSILSNFEENDFSYFKEEWIKYNAHHNNDIKLTKPNGELVFGKIIDLKENGSIIFENNKGEKETILTAEIGLT